MPLTNEMLNRHLDRILGDLQIQFTHKSITYGPAGVTRGPVSENQLLMSGGLDVKLDSLLYVKREVLGGLVIGVDFKIGDQITIAGSLPLKVHDIKTSADDAQLLTITLAWARR